MDAYVTVRYRLTDICDSSDLDEDYTFEQLIHDLINEEGVLGMADDAGEIIQIIKIED